MAQFMTEAADAALRDAIRAIERLSSAEVVIAVRPRLRRWLVPHVVVGGVFMAAMLAFVLFSEDYEFALWSIAVLPLLTAVLGGLLVEAIPTVGRALVPARVRDAIAQEAARSAFYDLGVHKTKGRTGVLVFIAVRERCVLLVGDVAIVDKLGDAGLARCAEALRSELPSGGVAVATVLASLAADFAAAMPGSPDDVNELADVVQGRRPARRFRGAVR
jgi:putative membrane protein